MNTEPVGIPGNRAEKHHNGSWVKAIISVCWRAALDIASFSSTNKFGRRTEGEKILIVSTGIMGLVCSFAYSLVVVCNAYDAHRSWTVLTGWNLGFSLIWVWAFGPFIGKLIGSLCKKFAAAVVAERNRIESGR